MSLKEGIPLASIRDASRLGTVLPAPSVRSHNSASTYMLVCIGLIFFCCAVPVGAESTDTTAPTVRMVQPTDGQIVSVEQPVIILSLSDADSGVSAQSIMLQLDGKDVTAAATVSASLVTYRPAQPLSRGVHKLVLVVSDRAGNTTTFEGSFAVLTVDPGASFFNMQIAGSNTAKAVLSGDEWLLTDEVALYWSGEAYGVPTKGRIELTWAEVPNSRWAWRLRDSYVSLKSGYISTEHGPWQTTLGTYKPQGTTSLFFGSGSLMGANLALRRGTSSSLDLHLGSSDVRNPSLRVWGGSSLLFRSSTAAAGSGGLHQAAVGLYMIQGDPTVQGVVAEAGLEAAILGLPTELQIAGSYRPQGRVGAALEANIATRGGLWDLDAKAQVVTSEFHRPLNSTLPQDRATVTLKNRFHTALSTYALSLEAYRTNLDGRAESTRFSRSAILSGSANLSRSTLLNAQIEVGRLSSIAQDGAKKETEKLVAEIGAIQDIQLLNLPLRFELTGTRSIDRTPGATSGGIVATKGVASLRTRMGPHDVRIALEGTQNESPITNSDGRKWNAVWTWDVIPSRMNLRSQLETSVSQSRPSSGDNPSAIVDVEAMKFQSRLTYELTPVDRVMVQYEVQERHVAKGDGSAPNESVTSKWTVEWRRTF